MTTVLVPNVPDDVLETYRRRAALAGVSLQEFLLAQLVAGVGGRRPDHVVADVERQIRDQRGRGYARGSSVDVVRSDRDAR